MPEPGGAGTGEVAGVGADLEPGTLLAAYRAGLFPMRLPGGRLAWWSPDPRGVLPLDGLHVSRSLARSCRRYTTTVDVAFVDVVRGCADPRRPGGWIDESFVEAYRALHDLGWAHSVEVWDDAGPGPAALVGGLYGVAVGGVFAAESKFHRARDASKVALVALVELLRAGGASLLDVQWSTPHLASLGVVEVTREEYGARLSSALALPLPAAFAEVQGS
jgi:leucyl/phenylalanyl-tRNA--protein transferase